MSSWRRFTLILLLALCTLTVTIVAPSGMAHAQASSQQTAHTQQSATVPAKPSMGIKSYWDGTLVTLSNDDMRVLAAGSFSLLWIISALPGGSLWVAGGKLAGARNTFNAANAYIHNQCYWFWVSTYKPDWGTYPCH